MLPGRSLHPEGLSGSGSRSTDAVPAAQVHHNTNLTNADAEFARFERIAVPMADGNGWRDPAEPVLRRGVTGEDWQRFIDDCGRLGKAVRA